MKNNLFWRDQRGIGPLAVILVIAIVLAIGGGVYYSKHHNQLNVTGNLESTTTANVSTNTSTTSGTIRDLLALGRNVMCAVSAASTTSNYSGTVYISGTMMRGDFTLKGSTGTTIDSHMIRDNGVVYAWSGSQGVKMNFGNLVSTGAQSKTNVNLDQRVNYQCSPWNVDSTKFSVPTTVHFTEINGAVQSQTNVNANTSGGIKIPAYPTY
jgi:hypothetical protein